jgi:uncharacterized repeat protein (TIGR01451 family)
MKLTKSLALMAALVISTAFAATEAGTQITNTATATFTDPTTSAAGSSASNVVSTLVLPVPNFTVTPNQTAGTTPDQDAPGQQKIDVLPGSVQEFTYVVTNTGNTPLVVQLDPRITITGVDRNDTDVQGLKYYSVSSTGTRTLLTDSNGDGLVETPAIVSGAVLNIVQEYTVPGTATANQFYGANPLATGLYDTTPDAASPSSNAYVTVVPDPVSGTGTLTDANNFNRVKVYSSSLLVGPIDANSPGGTAPTTGGSTDGRQDPPSVVTPGGTQPAYNDPNPNVTGTLVQVGINSNEQYAYPKADPEPVNPDRVTFINSVTNKGTLSDSFQLLPPTLTGGAPLPAGVSVKYFDASGNVLPTDPGTGYPVLQNVATGETRNFRVEVTYPDTASVNSPLPIISILVGIDSLSDAGILADATGTDIVYTPDLAFGDATLAVGTSPSPIVNQTVTPGTANNVAYYGMDVANLGGYADTFNVVGSVPVTLTDGSTQVLPVVYYTYTDTNNDGKFTPGIDALGTALVDTNGDGKIDTGVVAPNAEAKIVGLVTIPATARTGTTVLTQRATAEYGGSIREDSNNFGATNGDTLTVASTASTVRLKKTVDKASAKPGETLTYSITAANEYNTEVPNFVLTEQNGTTTNLFSNSTFSSVSASVGGGQSGSLLYRFFTATGNSGWVASNILPASIPAADVTRVDVGVNTNGDTTIDALDKLSVNSTFATTPNLTVTFKTIVK